MTLRSSIVKRLAGLCGLLLAAGGGGGRVAAAVPIVVGKPFPEVVLPSIAGGQPMSIASFRGQRVVLHVFASW